MSCAAPMAGGRKRRGGKMMKGGNFYGFTGALDGTTAGAGWGAVENTAVDAKGTPILDYAMPKVGGRRRRRTGKSKKATRKSRRVSRRRRTMRGGAGVYNVAGAGYGYAGTGSAGLADAAPYASRVGGAPMNADGVRSA